MPLRLPVYFRFAFRTSDAGDFESLVRKLVPTMLPAAVGIAPQLKAAEAPPNDVTRKLASYVVAARYEDLPAAVRKEGGVVLDIPPGDGSGSLGLLRL